MLIKLMEMILQYQSGFLVLIDRLGNSFSKISYFCGKKIHFKIKIPGKKFNETKETFCEFEKSAKC